MRWRINYVIRKIVRRIRKILGIDQIDNRVSLLEENAISSQIEHGLRYLDRIRTTRIDENES